MSQPPHERDITYRQTRLGPEERAWLQGEIDARPGVTREQLARSACERFGWYRPNGEPAKISCAVFLGRLERSGRLSFAGGIRQAAARRRRHVREDHAEILAALGPVAGMVECQPSGPLTMRPIAPEELAGFKVHMQRYHYLGFEKSVGESLCYAALLGSELVALLDWGAAVRHNGPREKFLGWSPQVRERRLPWVVNNRRYLVLPWVRQPHLASRVLGANLRRLSRDWQATYGHPVWLAETFVDPARFRGTCYRASNWIRLGQTRGFSRSREGFFHTGRRKDAYVFPLHRRTREFLCTMP